MSILGKIVNLLNSSSRHRKNQVVAKAEKNLDSQDFEITCANLDAEWTQLRQRPQGKMISSPEIEITSVK